MSTPTSLWKPLLQAALPGTAQAPAPGALGLPELEALNQTLPASSPEDQLLNQAAAVALFQRAGHSPLRTGHDLPAPATAEVQELLPESLQRIWRRLAQAWSITRSKPDWRLLQHEALNAFNQGGWRFPHALLPELLEVGNEWGRDDAQLRLKILPLLGQRGLWLGGGTATAQTVRQPWNWVFDPEQTQLPLARGATACSLFLLRQRQRDPDQARALLQVAWPQADAPLRIALLPCLSAQLQMADQDLLEAALDDKRREVRQQAQALLGRLPQSHFVARAQARMAPLLSLRADKKGGQELDLKLPSWPADPEEASAWQRDGLDKASFTSPAGRALVAEALLKQCPPAWWTAHLGCSDSELLELILASPAIKSLISGLAGAILNFADAEMAHAVLIRPAFWNRKPYSNVLPYTLVPVLHTAQQQAGYLSALRDDASDTAARIYAGVPQEIWTTRADGKPLAPLPPRPETSPGPTGDFLPSYFDGVRFRLHNTPNPAEADFWPTLLLPAFVILGAAPDELPRLLAFVREWLQPWYEAAGKPAESRDLDEMVNLLEIRHDLYQALAQLQGGPQT